MNFAELVLLAKTDSLRRGKADLVDLRNEGERTEKAVTGSMDSMSKGFSAAAVAAGKMALAVTSAITASIGIGQAIGVIREFESSMSQVAAITRANATELAALRDVAKELGSTTEFTAAQAADGLRFLGMAGFQASEAIAAIPAVLDLATASAMGLAEAADISSNVLSGFGLAAEDAAQVADVLAAASSRSNTSVSQLGNAMSTVAPIAAALDISLQDTAAAIGVLSDAGIQGERAGTALRGVLASLAGPTDAAADALAKYGISVAQVNPEAHSLTEIFGLLAQRGLSTADAMTIFGREAASGALVLAESSSRVGEFGDELRGAEGAAADMAGIMRDNLGGAANTLMSALQGLAIALGEAGLTAVLVFALDAATAFVRGLTAMTEAIGSVLNFIGRHIGAMEDFEAATVSATSAMQEQARQSGDVQIATDNAATSSRNAAQAALDEAKARMAVIDAYRIERAEKVMASEAYQELQGAIDLAAAELDLFYQLQKRDGGQFAPLMNDAAEAVDAIKTQLVLARAAQAELLESANYTSTEYINLEAEVQLLERKLAAAARAGAEIPDGVIPLDPIITSAGGNVSVLTRLLNGAAAAARALAGAMAQAAGSLGPLSVALSALGGGVVGRATGALGGVLGRIIDSDAVAAAGNRLSRLGTTMAVLFERSKAAAAAQAAFNETLGGGGGGGGTAAAAETAVEQLRKQIERERELIGLSEYAKAEIEALHRVEDALARDKATWSDAAIQALKDQILLNRQLTEEAERTSQVYKTIADGLAKGDLGSIGRGLLSQSQSAFSGELQKVFAGDKSFGSIFTDSFAGIGKALSGSGGLLGNIGGAISAAMPIVGAVTSAIGIVKSLIGTTEKLTNGIEGTFTTLGLVRGTEYDIKKRTNLFGSKTERNSEDIFDSWASLIANDLQMSFSDMSMTISENLERIGLQVQDFAYDFDIRFDESLPHDELMAQLYAEVSKAGEAMMAASLSAAGLSREGEAASETLRLLEQALTVANTNLSALGFALFDLTAFGANAAREFTDLFGGVDAFAQGISAYVDAFYDDADKLEVVTNRVSDMLSGLNVDNFNTALDSRENFRALTDWAGSNAANDPAQAQMFADLINVAPLIDQMFSLREALAETGDVVEDTTDAVVGLTDAQREEQSLLAQLYRLQGDTAALRQMELDAVAPVNRHILERIHALEDEQAAAQEAEAAARALADAQAAIANEAEGLLSRYERLIGDQEAIRARELAGVDEANRWILEMIHAREDEKAAMEAAAAAAAELEAALEEEAAKARAIADERAGLERRLLELLGDTAALRQLEIDAVDPLNQHLVVRYHAILDERAAAEAAAQAAEEAALALEEERQAQEALAAAAAAAAQAIADEAYALETQWLQAIGDVATLRARELELLDPTNRAMQMKIWAYLDERAALEAAAEAAREAEQALLDAAEAERQRAAAIADERYRLETRLYELQGNTALLRERELALLDPSNRELQKLIWSLEDAQAAANGATDGVSDLADVLSELRSEMREALSLVERLISAEIDAIQSAAQARIDALQSEIDMARDAAGVAKDTLQAAFDVVRASIDADRTMLVAGYTAAIERLDDRMEAATANVDRLRGVFDLLDNALSSRLLGGAVREGARYMQAQSYIRSLTGLPSDTGALEGALQALSGDGSRFYGSATDFEFDFLRTNAALSNLRSQAGGQLSDAERTVAAIEDAKAAREAQHEAAMARLDDQLAVAQGIYDEATGSAVELMDVGDGIDGLRAAAEQYTSLADQLLAIEAAAGAEIEAVRLAADAQVGLLEEQLAEARRSVEIAEGTYNSIETIQEAIDYLNQTIAAFSEANAAVNEQFAADTTQPIIDIPAEVADLRNENSEENARILEQNRQLTEEVRQLRDDVNQLLKSLVKNSSEVNTNIKRWEAIGLPPERTT